MYSSFVLNYVDTADVWRQLPQKLFWVLH